MSFGSSSLKIDAVLVVLLIKVCVESSVNVSFSLRRCFRNWSAVEYIKRGHPFI